MLATSHSCSLSAGQGGRLQAAHEDAAPHSQPACCCSTQLLCFSVMEQTNLWLGAAALTLCLQTLLGMCNSPLASVLERALSKHAHSCILAIAYSWVSQSIVKTRVQSELFKQLKIFECTSIWGVHELRSLLDFIFAQQLMTAAVKLNPQAQYPVCKRALFKLVHAQWQVGSRALTLLHV